MTCVNGECQPRCDLDTTTCINGQCVPLVCADYTYDDVNITYTYDGVGNRVQMTDSAGTTSYIHDYLNRLTSVTNPDSKTISYQYDASGNRIRLTDPDGNNTTYTYDNDNRLTDVNASGKVTTYHYDSLGRITEANYPNRSYTQYTYDPQRNWLTSLVNMRSTGAVISSYSYTYDNAGNRMSVTEQDGNGVNYVYDSSYQLTSETRTGTNAYTITYQYDSVGNRTKMIQNGVTTTYAYNNDNQLLTETTGGTAINYGYDRSGNLISKVIDTNNITCYTWDWNNHLVSESNSSDNFSFEYNGDGTRISKTQAGVKTKYINDVARGLTQVIMETDINGTTQAVYNYGRDLINWKRGSLMYYYLHDGLGSTRKITNSIGMPMYSYSYDAFGNIIASGPSLFNYGFTGQQQFNEADNLVFLRARYYKPEVGRFISRDPILEPIRNGNNFVWLLPYLIEYPQHLSPYVYVANNPVNFVDPYGLGWWSSFGEWLTKMIGKLCPGSWTVGAGEACLDSTSCLAYTKALEDLEKDPEFISDPNYKKLTEIAGVPAGK